MKKILICTSLIAFYVLTQLNFTTFGASGKKNCDDLKMAAKKCTKLLSQHQTKVKQIETSYNKASLDYSVNLTAENSAFVESYQLVAREAANSSEESIRGPASLCQAEEGQSLTSCMDQVKKIYQSLVPN